MGIFIGGKNKTLRPYQKTKKNNKKNIYNTNPSGIVCCYNTVYPGSTNDYCK